MINCDIMGLLKFLDDAIKWLQVSASYGLQPPSYFHFGHQGEATGFCEIIGWFSVFDWWEMVFDVFSILLQRNRLWIPVSMAD